MRRNLDNYKIVKRHFMPGIFSENLIFVHMSKNVLHTPRLYRLLYTKAVWNVPLPLGYKPVHQVTD